MNNIKFYRVILFAFIFFFLDLVSIAQSITKYESTQGFVAHEWGTFTTLRKSNGERLTGLQREEEHVPSFVYNLCLCFDYEDKKGFWGGRKDIIQNVNVKMETPVLYFYSSENVEKKVRVDVKFKNGAISQWYPNRSDGELTRLPYIKLDCFYCYGSHVSDFALPRTGWIQWDARILPPDDKSPYSSDPKLELPQWIAPRATASNLISVTDNYISWVFNGSSYDPVGMPDKIEKFLFYRGFGNFQEPIGLEFNKYGNLVVSNSGEEPINYFMVYEKRADGKISVWGSGSLPPNRKKVIQKLTNVSLITVSNELENFTKQLISAGLYEDEAHALIKTWEKSYFQNEGIKVFWIVPPKFTDDILPLQIEPRPDKIKRVMVGRSEILTPEFEQQLSKMSSPVLYGSPLYHKYSNDRFLDAYQEVALSPPTQWTDYNELENITQLDNHTANHYPITIFPNPVTGNLTITLKHFAILKIFAADGELVYFGNAGPGENILSTEIFQKGFYIVKAEYENGSFNSKKIVKE